MSQTALAYCPSDAGVLGAHVALLVVMLLLGRAIAFRLPVALSRAVS